MNTRETNMEKRRQRILTEARRTIAEKGFHGLNTRSLAQAAGVTQPTLYNLIGSKEKILLMLISETMGVVERRLETVETKDSVAQLEALAYESTKLFSEDEEFYRPAFIAHEYFTNQQEIWGKAGRLNSWAVSLGTHAFKTVQDQGLLRGSIPAALLSANMFTSYRVLSRDWALRLISIEEFRKTALQATYIQLAADAEESFHCELRKKLKSLD